LDTSATWAEIDLAAIAHNTAVLKARCRPARLMAVVKADGYGHGAAAVAQQALASGAGMLAVARFREAAALRQAGIDAPILIFGYTPADFAEQLAGLDLIQAVASTDAARQLADRARRAGKQIRVHIKIDTGMGRLGLLADRLTMDPVASATDCRRVAAEVESIVRLPGLVPEGIFTHFAAADSRDKHYTRRQFDIFTALLDTLARRGIRLELRHAANSAGIIDLPETHLDMVRAGIALYGLYPSGEVDRAKVLLRPAMSLKSRIVHLKKVPAGFNLSYGLTHTTASATVIATVAAGYADGVSRLLSNRGSMLVHGKAAPIIGRVCMDLCMLDIGHIPEAQLNDEVVIFGRQDGRCISADQIADLLNTINYEVVTGITARVPRVYLHP